MSVTSIYEQWDGRDHDEDETGNRTYSRVWLVTTSTGTDDATVVKSYAGLPRKWDAHPYDSLATARSISAAQSSDCSTVWKVTVKYSTSRAATSGLDNQNQPFNPLDRAAKIKWGFAQFQRAINYDINGKAIDNSAHDLYENVQIDDSRPVVTVTKNLAAVPSFILLYQDAINSDAFTIDGISIAKRQAKMNSIEISEILTENNLYYRRVTFTIHIRRETWQLKLVDEGFRELVDEFTDSGATGDYVWSTIQIDGKVPDKPVLLDGNGFRLYQSVGPGIGNAVPEYRYFDVYTEKPFSNLPLS